MWSIHIATSLGKVRFYPSINNTRSAQPKGGPIKNIGKKYRYTSILEQKR